MRWLCGWLPKRSERPATSRPSSNAFRPKVELLGDRIVPTVSTAITNVGTFTLAVRIDDVLVAVDPATGAETPTAFTNVRTAQAFRTASGGLGADIVFQDGSWQHIDNSGIGSFTFSAAQAVSQFGGLILDAGTAYNDKGQLRLDFLVSADNTLDSNGHTFSDALGSVKEFNQAAGGGLVDLGLGNNVRWVSTYESTDGGTGIAVGQVIKGGLFDTLLVRKGDAVAGVTTLYDGAAFGAGAVVEYSQTTVPPTPAASLNPTTGPRAAVIDMTFEGTVTMFNAMWSSLNDGGYAVQFGVGSTSGLPGLGSNFPNVIGLNADIKTGINYPGAMSAP